MRQLNNISFQSAYNKDGFYTVLVFLHNLKRKFINTKEDFLLVINKKSKKNKSLFTFFHMYAII